MASAEGFDLYTCEVCLENMLDKKPRLLSCHHSFCMDCLRKLMKNSAILCPTCKKATPVQNNDINSLTVNFILKKFKSHNDQMNSTKTLLCQFCLTENATLKCQECSQLMCQECNYKHKAMKTFKDHKIYKLCEKHKDGMITHICIKCAKPACAKCLMTEHFNHENDVEIFEEGISQIVQKIATYDDDVKAAILCVNEWKEHENEQLNDINTAISKVEGIKTYLLQKAKEAEEVFEQLKKKKVKGEESVKTCDLTVKVCHNVNTLLQKGLEDVKNGNLENYTLLKNKAEKVLDKIAQYSKSPFIQDDLTILDPRNLKEIKLISSKKPRVYLETPKLEKTISCTGNQQWDKPYNIRAVEGCVLISDWSKAQILYVHSSGKPTITIPAQYGNVRDAGVYQNYLYTAYENCVTKRFFYKGWVRSELKYEPDINNICSMAVVDNSSLILVGYKKREIVEFNPDSNQTKVVISDLDKPMQVNITRRQDDILYLVSQYDNHSISMYDRQWKLLFTFGGEGKGDGRLQNPWSTTCTTQGILVADQLNHRICLFSFNGEFIKHILTHKDGIECPLGLIFNSPYLWVTQNEPGSVKCFKICA